MAAGFFGPGFESFADGHDSAARFQRCVADRKSRSFSRLFPRWHRVDLPFPPWHAAAEVRGGAGPSPAPGRLQREDPRVRLTAGLALPLLDLPSEPVSLAALGVLLSARLHVELGGGCSALLQDAVLSQCSRSASAVMAYGDDWR